MVRFLQRPLYMHSLISDAFINPLSSRILPFNSQERKSQSHNWQIKEPAWDIYNEHQLNCSKIWLCFLLAWVSTVQWRSSKSLIFPCSALSCEIHPNYHLSPQSCHFRRTYASGWIWRDDVLFSDIQAWLSLQKVGQYWDMHGSIHKQITHRLWTDKKTHVGNVNRIPPENILSRIPIRICNQSIQGLCTLEDRSLPACRACHLCIRRIWKWLTQCRPDPYEENFPAQIKSASSYSLELDVWYFERQLPYLLSVMTVPYFICVLQLNLMPQILIT